ncbi:MAG: choice-of-anchor Q domain-containing protein [Planctomycetia bacterium]|nr:choice-of-anchor Q domain-containing protein [Planctomycetia bacterium]
MDSDSRLLVYTYDHGGGEEGNSSDYNDVLCGWGENLSGIDVATQMFKLKQGYVTTISAQCFSGGVIDDILDPATGTVWNKYVEGNKWYAMAAANHYETSWTSSWGAAGPFYGFGQSAIDALRITGEGAGLNNTANVFKYAKTDNLFTANETYKNNEGIWGGGEAIEHPWGAGASFDIFSPAPESYVVNTTEDIVDPNDGKFSLREAVLNSHAGDTIGFDIALSGQTFYLKSDLVIYNSLTINAAELITADNPYGITIDARGRGRVLTIDGSINTDPLLVSLKGIAFTGGIVAAKDNYGSGGAIYAKNANLEIKDCSFYQNKIADAIQNAKGGAVYSDKSIKIDHVSFYDNSTSGFGGAIYAGGNLSVINSEIYSNRAGNGGAIYSNASVSIQNSTLRNNYASKLGGAVYLINRNSAEAALEISGSKLIENIALSGGAVYISGSMSIEESILSGNSANDGGAIYSSYGNLEVVSSSLTGNSARDNGGALYVIGGSSDKVVVVNSKLDANHAGLKGGAIYLWKVGAALFTNDTIAANSAAIGGGIYVGSQVNGQMANSIIANNFAADSPDLCIYAGQKIVAPAVPVEEETEGDEEEPADPASLELVQPGALSIQYSLIGDTSTKSGIAFVDAGNNKTNTAAGFLAAPVFDEEGNLTNRENYLLFLEKDSVCIDAGSNALALNPDGSAILYDLVGKNRINNSIVDMGSYEYISDILPDLAFYTPEKWSAPVYITNVDDYREVGNAFKINEQLYLAFGSGNIGDAASAACSYTITSDNSAFTAISGNYAKKAVEEKSPSRIAIGSIAKAGTYYLTITLDSGKTIAEKNEWNNTYTVKIIIGQEAKSLVVNTEKDIIDPTDGLISLREAILYAKSGEKITFDTSMNAKTITLAGSELEIGKSITIDAAGLTELTVNANGASRVFSILAGNTVQINNLTIKGGVSTGNGGGILNAGTLTLKASTISGNKAATSGAGIYNSGTLTVDGGSIAQNEIRTGLSGGGIFNAKGAAATIRGGTQIQENTARYGGGIYNAGLLTVSASNDGSYSAFIYENEAAYGGALQNTGTANLFNTMIMDNTASTSGGGIANAGTVKLQNSSVSGNDSDGSGGGIQNYNGAQVEMINTELLANTAITFGGGIANAGTISLYNNTVIGNSVGNDEVVKYKASVYGGGIYSTGTAKICNSIIADNKASASYNSTNIGEGGGIYSTTADLIVDYCILAKNTAAIAGSENYKAPDGWTETDPIAFTRRTADLFSGYDSAQNWTDWDLKLAANSEAINVGNNANVSASKDKNGMERIVADIVDLGAYEYQTGIYVNGKTAISILYTTETGESAGILTVGGTEAVNPVFTLTSTSVPFVLDGNQIKVNGTLENGKKYELKITVKADGLDYSQSLFITAAATPVAAASEMVNALYGTQFSLSAAGSAGGEGASVARYYWYLGENTDPIITQNANVNLSTLQLQGDRVGLVVENEFGMKSEMVYTEVVLEETYPVLNTKKSVFGEDHVVKYRFDVSLLKSPVLHWRISWGDGSDPQMIDRASMNLTASHYYENAGQYEITLEIFTGEIDTPTCKYYIGSHTVPGEIAASEPIAPPAPLVDLIAESDWAESPLPIADPIIDPIIPFCPELQMAHVMNALDAGKSLWSDQDKEENWFF